MPEFGIDHPLEQETVVEYDHPNNGVGESEGEVWDCWGEDPLVYEILDYDELVRVRVPADDIQKVGDPR